MNKNLKNDSSCENCEKFQPYCKIEGKNKDNCMSNIINEECPSLKKTK